ncbi:MAG: DUF1186 domain-containing protein [Chloroflexi bacterium]|nr:DUF1186 domain-containing protein [Chloroflexota bacterium]
MQVPDILRQLKRYNGAFPRKALQAAIAHRDPITPELLAILDYTRQNAEALLEQPDYMGHMYAMYLLAQFREGRAYPLLIDLFSIPGDIAVDLTGDVVTEDLGRILASVSGGDMRLMAALAENRQANEWARSAALRSLVILAARGEKSRDDILACFQSLFQEKLEREESVVWSSLVDLSADLYPDMVYEDIKQAYVDNLVDPTFIDLDNVDHVLAQGKDKVLADLRTNRRYTFIEDTIKEMEWWACFRPQERPAQEKKKVGRNERCPCGSGLKYKHCCGKRH